VISTAAGSAKELRAALRRLGLSGDAIRAAWPAWWSEQADASVSARAELRFSVARRLGLDARSLFEDGGPRFLWRDEARFKHLSGESDLERAGITSFGRAVASSVISASPPPAGSIQGVSASQLRSALLRSAQRYVDLVDLLALAWGVGAPVVQLRVFPWPRKRMAAMTVNVRERSAVLLGKDSTFPAPIAFYLAHELGHVALGHTAGERLIVDLETESTPFDSDDEEHSADEFALELLTGDPRPEVVLSNASAAPSARELARIATHAAPALGIEPGILAQCFGYSTGYWKVVTGSLKLIYGQRTPVWQTVNKVARSQLDLERLPADAREFVETVLGSSPL
jgi:hypothetical protein